MGHTLRLASYRLVSVPYLPQMAHDEQTTDRETMNLDWQENAACSGTDTEVFFPEHDTSRANRDEQVRSALVALKLCAGCSVQAECFAYAMADDNSVYAGIYGGTLPYERKRLATEQGRNNIPGGSPHMEQGIRRQATKRGIPAPKIGVRSLNAPHDMESYFLA
jgi:WhiB family transcriptional regulator, redox-sensing transcriptional regulator